MRSLAVADMRAAHRADPIDGRPIPAALPEQRCGSAPREVPMNQITVAQCLTNAPPKGLHRFVP